MSFDRWRRELSVRFRAWRSWAEGPPDPRHPALLALLERAGPTVSLAQKPPGGLDVAWVPSPYRFAGTLAGGVRGFARPDQLIYTYVRQDIDPKVRTFPISVAFARDPTAVLSNTPAPGEWPEPRSRADGSLGLWHQVEYHDGHYGPPETRGGPRTWHTGGQHAVVARSSTVTVAVRGSRLFGVTEFDLLGVLASVTLVEER